MSGLRSTWARKEAPAAEPGPLKGVALQRMRAMPTSTLLDWIDASVTKVGKLVADSHGVNRDLLEQARIEAGALVQALGELQARNDPM